MQIFPFSEAVIVGGSERQECHASRFAVAGEFWQQDFKSCAFELGAAGEREISLLDEEFNDFAFALGAESLTKSPTAHESISNSNDQRTERVFSDALRLDRAGIRHDHAGRLALDGDEGLPRYAGEG